MSEFSQSLSRKELADQEDNRRLQRMQNLIDHMTDISGDPGGSPVGDYLQESDQESCRDFLIKAERTGYPGAHDITMSHRRFGDRLLWSSPGQYSKRGRPYTNFGLKKVWEGKGYPIGTLELMLGKAALYLCPSRGMDTEGELRIDRTPNIFLASHGLGYGRLPNLPTEELPIKVPKLASTLVKHIT